MEFVQNECGRRKLIYNDYIYVKQKELTNNVISYECEKRRRGNCKAKVKVCGNEIVGHVNDHNHAANQQHQEVLSIRQEVKRKAINIKETAKRIITQAVQNISEGASLQLPPARHIQHGIRCYKQAIGNPQPIPPNFPDMVPSEYKIGLQSGGLCEKMSGDETEDPLDGTKNKSSFLNVASSQSFSLVKEVPDLPDVEHTAVQSRFEVKKELPVFPSIEHTAVRSIFETFMYGNARGRPKGKKDVGSGQMPPGVSSSRKEFRMKYFMWKGWQKELVDDMEQQLRGWILQVSAIGYETTKKDIANVVKEILDKAGACSPFPENRPSAKWVYTFLHRHPKLSDMGVTTSSNVVVSDCSVKRWLQGLENHLVKQTELSLVQISAHGRGAMVYVCSEMGFLLNMDSSVKSLPLRTSDTFSLGLSTFPRVSVLGCVCGNGQFSKPLVVYPREQIPPADSSSRFDVYFSPDGLIDSDVFFKWLNDIFYPEIKRKRGVSTFPVLLLLDAHCQHLSLRAMQFCEENDIILYCLLPHSGNILQTVNISIYDQVKNRWEEALKDLPREDLNVSVSASNFLDVFESAWTAMQHTEDVPSAFRQFGLLPVKPCNPDLSGLHSSQRSLVSPKEVAAATAKKCLQVVEDHLDEDLKGKFERWCQNDAPPVTGPLWYIYRGIRSVVEDAVSQEEGSASGNCMGRERGLSEEKNPELQQSSPEASFRAETSSSWSSECGQEVRSDDAREGGGIGPRVVRKRRANKRPWSVSKHTRKRIHVGTGNPLL